MYSIISVVTTSPKVKVDRQLSITSSRSVHDVTSAWVTNTRLMNGILSSHLRYLGGDDGSGEPALG